MERGTALIRPLHLGGIRVTLEWARAQARKGQLGQAAELCREVLTHEPQNIAALRLLGEIELRRTNPQAALVFFDRALAIRPGDPKLCCQKGDALSALNRLDEALAHYDRALALDPADADAHNNRGNVLRDLMRPAEALLCYDRALRLRPGAPGAHSNRGNTLRDLGRFNEALVSYDRALELKPDYASAHLGRGLALKALQRSADALAAFERMLAIRPDHVEALNNRGIVLKDMNRLDEALASYERALALQPGAADVLNNRGNALIVLRRFDEALETIERALALQPDFAEALNNRGIVLLRQRRLDDALASFDRALTIKAANPEAFSNRGNVLRDMKRLDDALASFDRALELDPLHADAHDGRGAVLRVQGRIDEAIAAIGQARALKPDDPVIHTNLIFALNFVAKARAADKQAERARWNKQHAEPLARHIEPHGNDRTPERRLRVGYVSSHFRRQAATYSFGGVILHHDPNAVESVCYSDTAETDDVTVRLRERAGLWRQTAGLSDAALAAQIRADRIDILVDLVGHMAGHRLGVFARKPAPVAVTAWGEPTGTGLRTMDYLFADATLVSASEAPLLSERVIALPNFLGYWTPEVLPEAGPLPALTRGHVTFGSFNRLDKISEPAFRLWATILRRAPSAHLVLKDWALADASQRTRLATGFSAEGIAPERVRFLAGSGRIAHFEALRTVDLALDPFPHSGGMTTLDSLWMGVPVVSWAGDTISSRLAAASLNALGLSDFIASDPDAYVELALAKAANISALSELRGTLRPRMAASEFGDPLRYCRAVERAYRAMWRLWCNDQAPGPAPITTPTP